MTNSVFFVRVKGPEGMREYATVLPPEVVSTRGLPAEAIVGLLTEARAEGDDVPAQVFTPNPVFVRFMHDVLATHAARQESFVAEARRVGSGYVYVMDARTADPAGAVPREDVIGAVKVEGGVPVPDSYRANPDHQLLTARGFFQLGEELHGCLMRELEALPRGG
ncbi:MAG TPA: hypothetical protein VFJ16_10155 [Longimicrobium sp.]|nr:hypothetical protein [Longimicrobium sp.]